MNISNLPIMLGLFAGAHILGSLAIHYQNIALFSVVFALNGSLGCAIFLFHAMSDMKVSLGVYDIYEKAPPKIFHDGN